MEYGANDRYDIEKVSEMISAPASRYGIVRIWLLSPENRNRGGDYEFCAETAEDMPLSDIRGFFSETRDAMDADIDIEFRRCGGADGTSGNRTLVYDVRSKH